MDQKHLSRREMLKLGAMTAGGLALPKFTSFTPQAQFPQGDGLLGRATASIPAHELPNPDSAVVRYVYEDEVLVWGREVVGYNPYRYTQRFIETPIGFVWSPDVQPVYNRPQTPVTELPHTSLGAGMWVEVSVPYADVILVNPPPRSFSLDYRMNELGMGPRLYYSQIMWVDQIEVDADGQVWYQLKEHFGYGDILKGAAESFRPITPEELSPISPQITDKYIEVNVQRQTVTCYENGKVVHFCRASTGRPNEDDEETATPIGESFTVWRKMISAHMAGGTVSSGWDTPGIGYCTYFHGSGVAIHATFWHNAYGERRSHGCVNVRPDDAKWIFRWSAPQVNYDPGDITVDDYSGTHIRVVEE